MSNVRSSEYFPTTSQTQAIEDEADVEELDDDIVQDTHDLDQHVLLMQKEQLHQVATSEELRARYQKLIESGEESNLAERRKKALGSGAARPAGPPKSSSQKDRARSKTVSPEYDDDGTDQPAPEVSGTEKAALQLSVDGGERHQVSAYLARDREARHRALDQRQATPQEKEQYFTNYDRAVEGSKHVDAVLQDTQWPYKHPVGHFIQALGTESLNGPSAAQQVASQMLEQVGEKNLDRMMKDLSTRIALKERLGKSPAPATIQRLQTACVLDRIRHVSHICERLTKSIAACGHKPQPATKDVLLMLLRPDQATVASLTSAIGKPALSPRGNAKFYAALEKAIDSLPVTLWPVDNMDQRQRLLSDLRTEMQLAYPTAPTPEIAEEDALRNRLVGLLHKEKSQAIP